MGITKQRIEEENNYNNYDKYVGWVNGINSINQSKKNHISRNITPRYLNMTNYLEEYNMIKSIIMYDKIVKSHLANNFVKSELDEQDHE